MAIAIGLSAWQQLGLEWQLAIATVRTVVQLAVAGYVLAVVLAPEEQNPVLIAAFLLLMLTLVAIVTRNRISQKLPRLLPWVWGTIGCSAVLIGGYTQLLIIQPTPWYNAQYLIPLIVVIFGNSMNSATITGERLVSLLKRSHVEIETHLSLGATPQQAVRGYRREAIRAGLMPTLNSMMIVGIVTLPGILTGQLLAGVNPLDAVSYQILILFMVAIANLITTLLLSEGICRQFFNPEAQLRRF